MIQEVLIVSGKLLSSILFFGVLEFYLVLAFAILTTKLHLFVIRSILIRLVVKN